MAKKTIHIDRPDNAIPGLLQLNEVLYRRYKIRIVVEVDTENKDRYTWYNIRLLEEPWAEYEFEEWKKKNEWSNEGGQNEN